MWISPLPWYQWYYRLAVCRGRERRLCAVGESSTMVLSAGVCRGGERRLCAVGAGSWARMCASKLTNACAISVRSGGGGMLPSRVTAPLADSRLAPRSTIPVSLPLSQFHTTLALLVSGPGHGPHLPVRVRREGQEVRDRYV